MEYQAKELFAKHGVPVTLGIVAEHPARPRGRRRAARRRASSRRRSRPAAAARPAASSSPRPPTRPCEHASNILGMEIKGLTVNRVLIAPAASIEEEYYFSFLLDRANRQYLCIASVEGGVEIEEVAKTNPDAVKQIPIDPGTGVDEAKARAIVAEANFPEPRLRAGRADDPRPVEGLRRGGRHAGRGQPARPAGRRQARGARRQGLARRERRVPSPRARATSRSGGGRPARGEGQGQGPQLRQARRCRRHHRQRRGPGHVDPRRRRVRRREARRREAGELPRHRWRRERPGDGRRPRRDPPRPAGQERVRERLRRHHRLRRGRQRHRRRARASSATRRPSRSSYASTATTSRRAGASSPRPTTRW